MWFRTLINQTRVIHSFIHSFIHPFIHSFIHSLCSLSYDRSLASSKASSPEVRSSASCFSLHYLLFSLRSSSSCLHVLPRLPVIYLLPSNFPSITCFRRQFLSKLWPIQLDFLLFILCRIFLSSLTLINSLRLSFSQEFHRIAQKYFWEELITGPSAVLPLVSLPWFKRRVLVAELGH
jgi:hypothetical protein